MMTPIPNGGVVNSFSSLNLQLNAVSNELNKYPAKQHARKVALKLQRRDGLIYIPGQTQRYLEDSDQFVPFRQRRYFYYVSGVDLPDCFITYDIAKDSLILYIPYVDTRAAVWFGAGLSLSEAQSRYDVDEVKFAFRLQNDLEMWISRHGRESQIFLLHEWQQPEISTKPPSTLFDSSQLQLAMNAARVIKDEHEIDLIRRANDISSDAHTRVLKHLSTFTNERQIEASFLNTCISAGVKTQAYKTIVGSGKNAAVLHYMKNDEPLMGRQLVCLDAGCDWHCYASDITRTFPISGTFSPEAKRIYALVQRMQAVCIDGLKPGVRYRDLDRLAHHIMIEGLRDMGILKQFSKEEIYGSGADRIFLPHGLGHHVGLEVHDVFEKPITGTTKDEDGSDHQYLSPCTANASLLEEGMVVTVEPGIYFSHVALQNVSPEMESFIDLDVARTYLPVGGVRIEDDVLITRNGHELLTKAPKGEEALEIIRVGPDRCRES